MTANGKMTATRIACAPAGTIRVLVTDDQAGRAVPSANPGTDNWQPAYNKRGMAVATVTGVDVVEGNKQRRYTFTTDIGLIQSVTGAQTFWLAPDKPDNAEQATPEAGALTQWRELATNALMFDRPAGASRVEAAIRSVHGLPKDASGEAVEQAQATDGRTLEELASAYLAAYEAPTASAGIPAPSNRTYGKMTTGDIAHHHKPGTVTVLLTDDPAGNKPTADPNSTTWYPARTHVGMTPALVTACESVTGGGRAIRRWVLTTSVGNVVEVVGAQKFLTVPAAPLEVVSGPHEPVPSVSRCDVGGERLTSAWWLVRRTGQGWVSDSGASCAEHAGQPEPSPRAVFQPCPTGYSAAVEAIAERLAMQDPAAAQPDPLDQWADIHTEAHFMPDGAERIGRVFETVHGLGADATGADLDRARNADGRSAEELCRAYIDAWHAQDQHVSAAPVSSWAALIEGTTAGATA